MNRTLTAVAALVALLATYGWISAGGDTALLPGLFGAASGVVITILHRRTSTRSATGGIVVAAGIVATLVVLADELALFFGAVTAASIVATDLTLRTRSRSTSP